MTQVTAIQHSNIRELLVATVIYLVLASLVADMLVAAAISLDVRAVLAPRLRGQEQITGYGVVVIPLKRLHHLIGMDIRGLRAFVETPSGPLETEALILPRGISNSFLPELGETAPLPYYDSPRASKSDILVVKIPGNLLQENMTTSTTPQRHSGAVPVPGENYDIVRIAINRGSTILVVDPLHHKAAKKSLHRALAVLVYSSEKPIPPLASPTSSLLRDLGLAILGKPIENSNDLDKLKKTLLSISVENISVSKLASHEQLHGGNSPSSANAPPKFYWFTLPLLTMRRVNFETIKSSQSLELSARRQVFEEWVYLGPYVRSIMLHVEATGGNIGGCFKLVLELWKWGYEPIEGARRELLTSRSQGPYQLSPGEEKIVDIYLPSTSLSSSLLEAHVRLLWCNGSARISSLILGLLKMYPGMPLPHTRWAIDLLSYGIAASYPAESRLAKYVKTRKGYVGGIRVNTATIDTVTLSIDRPNGIYLDYGGSDDAYLIVDVLAENTGHRIVGGSLALQINGYTYAERNITINPGSHGIVRFTVPYKYYTSYLVRGIGGYVTIHTSIRSRNVELYIDAALVYKYLPGVWSPESRSWIDYELPALRYTYNLYTGATATYKASLAITSPFLKPARDYTGIYLKVARTPVGKAINTVEVVYKVPESLAPLLTNCRYADNSHVDERGMEKYASVATSIHRLVAVIIRALSIATQLPESIMGITNVSGIAINILRGLNEQTFSRMHVEIINGEKYHVYYCAWSRGWLTDPGFIEVMAAPQIIASRSGAYRVYVGTTINGEQTVQASTVLIVVSPNEFTGIDEPAPREALWR